MDPDTFAIILVGVSLPILVFMVIAKYKWRAKHELRWFGLVTKTNCQKPDTSIISFWDVWWILRQKYTSAIFSREPTKAVTAKWVVLVPFSACHGSHAWDTPNFLPYPCTVQCAVQRHSSQVRIQRLPYSCKLHINQESWHMAIGVYSQCMLKRHSEPYVWADFYNV